MVCYWERTIKYLMKIIENYLKPEEFNNFKSMFFKNNFPWFLNTILPDIKEKQFAHYFFKNHQKTSLFFDSLKPFIEQLSIYVLLRAKANLLIKTNKHIEHGYHIDDDNKKIPIKTAIFYINTNNGYTKFKTGEKILSKENTLVVFDNQEEHTGSTCTDEEYRLVLNINYIEGTYNVI
jgi:hypothetical protein